MKKNNYFPMPNEIFCLGLNSGELAVYTYLMSCEERETYQCYPSYNTIGTELFISLYLQFQEHHSGAKFPPLLNKELRKHKGL